MNALKTYLAGLSTGAILLAIAGGLFLAGDFQELRHLRAEQTRPRELEQTAATGRAAEKAVPCPDGGILAPDLNPKAASKLLAKYGKTPRPASEIVGGDLRPDLPRPAQPQASGEAAAAVASSAAGTGEFRLFEGPAAAPAPAVTILGEFAVPRAPHGGTELATLEQDQRVHLTFRANPTPYLEWLQTLELGAGAGKSSDGALWRVWGAYEPFLVGHLFPRGEGGIEGRAGSTGWYVFGSVVYRRAMREP
jgi:hypothetical protein